MNKQILAIILSTSLTTAMAGGLSVEAFGGFSSIDAPTFDMPATPWAHPKAVPVNGVTALQLNYLTTLNPSFSIGFGVGKLFIAPKAYVVAQDTDPNNDFSGLIKFGATYYAGVMNYTQNNIVTGIQLGFASVTQSASINTSEFRVSSKTQLLLGASIGYKVSSNLQFGVKYLMINGSAESTQDMVTGHTTEIAMHGVYASYQF